MLRPCKNEVNEMSKFVVSSKGCAVTRRTVRSLRTSELHSETEKRNRRMFDDVIQKKLCDSATIPILCNDRYHIPYSDDVDPNSV